MWVDRLHSVHQVLVQPTRPPQAPYLVGSRTRGAYCANGPGCDPSSPSARMDGQVTASERHHRTSPTTTLRHWPACLALTGVARLCATLLVAVASGAALPPTVAHGAAGPAVERPAMGDQHAGRRAHEPTGWGPTRGEVRRARAASSGG